jgi:hypothetical protein
MPVHHICERPSLDLDGNGRVDRFDEVRDSRGTGGASYEVSVGGRKVGEIEGCWFQLGKRRAHGLYDIETTWRGGARIVHNIRYRFDGHRYRVISDKRSASSE